MTNPMKPGIEHTRVASASAMRARAVSRDREAEEEGLRGGGDVPTEPPAYGRQDPPADDQPQPADRRDS
jgi:hypothetical protein